MTLNIATIMDGTVIALLAAMVFFAYRLTVHLKNFRDGRAELGVLLTHLSANIERAENAIAGMQNAAKASGGKLQDLINESKFLSDELRFMNEAGNNLANRLEKLAERNSDLASSADIFLKQPGAGGVKTLTKKQADQKQTEQRFQQDDDKDTSGFGFAIHDREFQDDEDGFADGDEILFEDEDIMPHLQSAAERELFEALQKGRRKKAVTGGGHG